MAEKLKEPEPKEPEPTEPTEPKEPEPTEPTEPKEPEPKDDGIKDKHGQPGINKERHEKQMAEKDAKIAELQSQLDELTKTAQGREEVKAELDKLREEFADERVTFELEKAGCKSPKAAKALLDDYEGDIAKLKEAAPFLFDDGKPHGSTGKKPTGVAGGSDETELDKKLRKAFGL